MENGIKKSTVLAIFGKFYGNKLIDFLSTCCDTGLTLTGIYKATLTQSGTITPIATIIENTLGDIVWTRFSGGNYDGTLTGAFPVKFTFILCANGNNTYIIYRRLNDNVVRLTTAGGDGTLTDTAIEIQVYS